MVLGTSNTTFVGLLLVSSMTWGCSASDSGGAAAETGSTSAGSGTTSGSDDDPGSQPETTDGTQVDTGSTTAESSSASTSTSTSDGSESSSGDESTTGEAITCVAGNVCVGEVPDGWNGPAALRDIPADGGIADCQGAYPELLLADAYSGPVGEDFECDCACELGDVACDGSAVVDISNHQNSDNLSPCIPSNGGTDGLVQDAMVTPDDPTAHPAGERSIDPSLSHGVTVSNVDTSLAGECLPVAMTTESPTAWTARTILCGSPSSPDETCGMGETCVTRPLSPYASDVCIWAEGELACPEAYPDQTVHYREIEDNRGCSECQCGSADGDCVDPSVGVSYWYPNFIVGGGSFPGLTAPLLFDAPSSSCEPVSPSGEGFPYSVSDSVGNITFDAGTLVLDDQDAPCPSSGGAPQGDVVGSDPVTICCTAP